MMRILAGAAAAFFALTGAFFLWQGHAANAPAPQPQPGFALAAGGSGALAGSPTLGDLDPPAAEPADREARRFSRADKNRDGKVSLAEVLDPRRKAFAKLDKDGNGALSFDEWAVRTEQKLAMADGNHDGWLSPEEYARTAPKRPRHKICSC